MKRHSRFPTILLTLAALWTLAAPARAWTAKGAGECKDVRDDLGEDDRFWLLGFISGVNFARGADVAKSRSAIEIFNFVKTYCEEHKDADMADAGAAYIKTQPPSGP